MPKTAEPLILTVPTRFTPDDVAALDEWRRRQPDLPSRSEAIRRMVRLVAQPAPENRG
jgi:hypothetical protein